MEIFDGTVNRPPVVPLGVANKQYVDDKVQSGVSDLILGQVYVIDVIPTTTGITGTKLYVANTVPANAVLTDASSDTTNVRVKVYAEGGYAFFSPTITVNGVTATLSKIPVAGDVDASRNYFGYADIVISGSGDTTVNVVSSTGSTATAVIHKLAGGPAVNVLTIGTLPGSQTEVKSGDIVGITGTVDNTATYAEILATGAATSIVSLTLGAVDSGGAGKKTISGNFTVSGGTGAQSVSVRARNSFGTYGSTTVSSNTVTLNQTYPTIGAFSVAYPATQGALKAAETATVSSVITNANTYSYTSSADLTVTAPTTYAVGKVVTRVGGGYVNSGTNYTVTATKTSNNAVTTASTLVKIANTAPTAAITVLGNPAYLSSSPAGSNYTITITASQALNTAPSMVASGGSWIGSWVGAGTTWTRTLVITDSDVRGGHTFNTLSLMNLANVAGSSITSGANYIIGGFSLRSITFSAFSQYEAIGLPVTDITKVHVLYSGVAGELTQRNDVTNFVKGFTITNGSGVFNATGGYLFLTDSEFAGSNTTGTLIVTIEEVA
jgi:hypothetical protein